MALKDGCCPMIETSKSKKIICHYVTLCMVLTWFFWLNALPVINPYMPIKNFTIKLNFMASFHNLKEDSVQLLATGVDYQLNISYVLSDVSQQVYIQTSRSRFCIVKMQPGEYMNCYIMDWLGTFYCISNSRGCLPNSLGSTVFKHACVGGT